MRIFKTRDQLQGFITTCTDDELRSLLQQRLEELADYQLQGFIVECGDVKKPAAVAGFG